MAYTELNSELIKLTQYKKDWNMSTTFYISGTENKAFIGTTNSLVVGMDQSYHNYIAKLKFTLPQATSKIKLLLTKKGYSGGASISVFHSTENFTENTLSTGLGLNWFNNDAETGVLVSSQKAGYSPDASLEIPNTSDGYNETYYEFCYECIIEKTFPSGDNYLYLYWLTGDVKKTAYLYGANSSIENDSCYLKYYTESSNGGEEEEETPSSTDPSSTLGPPSIINSTIGLQNTYISENNNKRDFSTLYEHLQQALQERSYSSSLFSKNIKRFYDENVNKTFLQNNIINANPHANATINIITKFKQNEQAKGQFSIINSLNNYDNIVLKLLKGDEATPYCCEGECVGFCVISCGISCDKACVGEAKNIYQDADEPVGCPQSCSTACATSCGDGCSDTCDGQGANIQDIDVS